MFGQEARREEAAHDRIRDRGHAAGQHGKAAGFHPLGVGPRRGVSEHERRHPVRRVRAEPLADHAAEREAAECEPGNAERVGEREHVRAELRDLVVAQGHAGGAVPADVVSHDAEMRGEIFDVRIPHAVVLAEGVRQDQGWAIVASSEPVEAGNAA